MSETEGEDNATISLTEVKSRFGVSSKGDVLNEIKKLKSERSELRRKLDKFQKDF